MRTHELKWSPNGPGGRDVGTKRGARAVGLEIDAERAEAARANGCSDVRTCNALDEAEWSKAFDDQVTCAFLYLVPRLSLIHI